VELDEVVRRILRRHFTLIAALVLAGLVAVFFMHLRDTPQYRATARLVLNAPDPTNTAQSAVLADTARAIATSQALIIGALRDVGANRDALGVARGIDVRSLGSSGVLALSVTDKDPVVAVKLANAVARSVVHERLSASDGRAEETAKALSERMSALETQITKLNRRVDAALPRAASSRPDIAVGAGAELQVVVGQRDALQQQLARLSADRDDIESNLALRPTARLIDAATTPADRLPGRRLPDLALGGLLGLLLGVGLASVLESLRPTLVGRSAIARWTNAPVLAELDGPPIGRHVADIAEAAMYVGMAAAGAGVQRVELMALDRKLDVTGLADAFSTSLLEVTVRHVGRSMTRRTVGAQDGIGLVLVVPSAVKLAALDPVKDFLAISGWPLLGVIVVNGPRPRIRPSRRAVRREQTPVDHMEVTT